MSGVKRWCAIVTYRSDNGPVDVQHDIEELDEIADLVEAGPDWGAISSIHITLARPSAEGMTLEEAERVGQMTSPEWDAWNAKRERA